MRAREIMQFVLPPRIAWASAGIAVCALVLTGCIPEVADENISPLKPLTWHSAPGMSTARAHPVVATTGGKIYVIGGDDGTSVFPVVEEYDIAGDRWTNCGGGCAPIPIAITQATSGVIGGQIYVIGGFTTSGGGGPIGNVQVYDPASNAWGTTCNGNPCDAISGTQFAQVTTTSAGGVLYLAGGNAVSPDFTLFNPAQAPGVMFSYCPALPCLPSGGRARAGSTVLNNVVYVLGGYDGGLYASTLSTFDIGTATWTDCGGTCPTIPLDPNPQNPTLATVPGGMDPVMGASNGVVFAMAMNDNSAEDYVQSFDTATFTWTSCGGACPNIPVPVGSPGSVQVGNRLYLFGGGDGIAATFLVQIFILP